MHEMSMAIALIEQAEAALPDDGALVSRVVVSVGVLSGVDPEALVLAFPLAAEDTRLQGAALDIRRVPASMRCRACGDTTTPDFPFFVCAACGSDDVDIAAGRELMLESMELEDEDEDRSG